MNSVLNHYEAAYKKTKSGKLLWITCKAKDSHEAGRLMDTHIAKTRANEVYRRYAGALLVK